MNHSLVRRGRDSSQAIMYWGLGVVFLIMSVVDILLGMGYVQFPIPVLLTVSLLLKSWVVIGVIYLLRHRDLLYRQIEVDSLTKAYTREVFFNALQRLLSDQGGNRSVEDVSLILFDLDDFKCVNDQLGHQAGDRVLVNASSKVIQTIRHDDIFSRLGGEEFGIVLPRTSLDEAVKLAERLRIAVYEPSIKICPISASFGVSVWSREESADQMYNRVDRLMYRAKASGKNTVVAE